MILTIRFFYYDKQLGPTQRECDIHAKIATLESLWSNIHAIFREGLGTFRNDGAIEFIPPHAISQITVTMENEEDLDLDENVLAEAYIGKGRAIYEPKV